MDYQINMADSAKRHFTDGDHLLKAKSSQHAGYHFGFAVECAIKLVLFQHNIPRRSERRNDPFWAHFPELRTLLVRDGKGRLPGKLYSLIAHSNFLEHWDTDIRYARNHSVDADRASVWRKQADDIFGVIFF
jgi:hypothetical protein